MQETPIVEKDNRLRRSRVLDFFVEAPAAVLLLGWIATFEHIGKIGVWIQTKFLAIAQPFFVSVALKLDASYVFQGEHLWATSVGLLLVLSLLYASFDGGRVYKAKYYVIAVLLVFSIVLFVVPDFLAKYRAFISGGWPYFRFIALPTELLFGVLGCWIFPFCAAAALRDNSVTSIVKPLRFLTLVSASIVMLWFVLSTVRFAGPDQEWFSNSIYSLLDEEVRYYLVIFSFFVGVGMAGLESSKKILVENIPEAGDKVSQYIYRRVPNKKGWLYVGFIASFIPVFVFLNSNIVETIGVAIIWYGALGAVLFEPTRVIRCCTYLYVILISGFAYQLTEGFFKIGP